MKRHFSNFQARGSHFHVLCRHGLVSLAILSASLILIIQ